MAKGKKTIIKEIKKLDDEILLINGKEYVIVEDTQNIETAITMKISSNGNRILRFEDEKKKATIDVKRDIEIVKYTFRDSSVAKKFAKAVHALAPQSNSVNTPVLGTTGATVAGKKLATVNDIIDLGGALSAAGVPDDGNRILVLNTVHNTGLVKEVKDFYKDYLNIATGQLRPLFHGFKVYLYHAMPFYLASNNTKVSFGAIFNPAVHNVASVVFYAPDMFRATGSTTMYYDEPDTQNQAAAVNYRHYFLVSPKKARAIGALVTTNA